MQLERQLPAPRRSAGSGAGTSAAVGPRTAERHVGAALALDIVEVATARVDGGAALYVNITRALRIPTTTVSDLIGQLERSAVASHCAASS